MSQGKSFKPNYKCFKWTPERLQEVADSLNKWIDKSIEEKSDFLLGDWAFNSNLGFLPSYFARYRERSVPLDEAYLRAKEWQEYNISKGALFNKLNSRFAALWLSHAHGWKMKDGSEDRNATLANEFGQFLEMRMKQRENELKDEEDE